MQIPTLVLIADGLVRNARRSIKKARHIQVRLKNWGAGRIWSRG
jgi:hypothetical protein